MCWIQHNLKKKRRNTAKDVTLKSKAQSTPKLLMDLKKHLRRGDASGSQSTIKLFSHPNCWVSPLINLDSYPFKRGHPFEDVL